MKIPGVLLAATCWCSLISLPALAAEGDTAILKDMGGRVKIEKNGDMIVCFKDGTSLLVHGNLLITRDVAGNEFISAAGKESVVSADLSGGKALSAADAFTIAAMMPAAK